MLQLVRGYWTETKPQDIFCNKLLLAWETHQLKLHWSKLTWPPISFRYYWEKKTFHGIEFPLSKSKDKQSFVISLKIRKETFLSRHLHIHWLRAISDNFVHTTPYKISNHRIYAHSYVLINGDIREAWNMNLGTANILISEIFKFLY